MDEYNKPFPPQEVSEGPVVQPQPEFRPLGIGGLLKRTWAVYKSRFWILTRIAAFIVIGNFLLRLFVGFLMLIKRGTISEYPSLSISEAILFFSVIFIIGLLLTFWSAIALLFAIHEREQQIGSIDSFRKAWTKLPSYIWILILAGLCELGGIILLIIPGIIFAVWFSFASYVLIAENIKGKRALAKSKALVKGHWWKVFWILIILITVEYVIVYLSGLAPVIGGVLPLILGILIIPFVVILFFLVYEDLRGMNEELLGLSPEKTKREREDFKIQK